MGTEIFIPEGATFNPAVMGYDSLGRKRCNFKIYDSLDNEVPFDFDPDTNKIRIRLQNKTIGVHNLKIKFFNDVVDSTVLKTKYGENYTASLGLYHSSAITETGKLYIWGYNDFGQVGDGTTTQRNTPTLIDSFGGEKIVAASLGLYHSSAITETGKLYIWGYNGYGQVGDGTTTQRNTPTLIDAFNGEKVVAVSLGYYHSSAITETGKLYTWGHNGYGQVGDGTTTQRNTPTLIDSFGGEKIVSVSLGTHHSSTITETGKLYIWGYNDYGQVGDGTTTNKTIPTLIDFFGGEKIVAVSLGASHSSAITETGKLYTWGDNGHGQLGDGTTTDKTTPTLIGEANFNNDMIELPVNNMTTLKTTQILAKTDLIPIYK